MLEEILDLVEEQKDLNKFWYLLFNFKDVSRYLNTIFEYIINPIMLDDQKEFKDDHVLDWNLFFKKLKKTVKIPNWKIVFALILITILIIFIFLYFYCFNFCCWLWELNKDKETLRFNFLSADNRGLWGFEEDLKVSN